MNDTTDRIAQFENMASADPDNEMAHFSLGNAYLEDGRAAEASKSLSRAIELNPEMSRAYELAGQAMINAGWTDQAAETLITGYQIAAGKGERKVMSGIEQLLQSMGRSTPTISEESQQRSEALSASGSFVCQRTGRPGHQLDGPPFRGPIGLWIYEHIAKETWDEWIGQGTKVINELRLDFSREEDQDVYDRHMYEYLGIDADEIRQAAKTNE